MQRQRATRRCAWPLLDGHARWPGGVRPQSRDRRYPAQAAAGHRHARGRQAAAGDATAGARRCHHDRRRIRPAVVGPRGRVALPHAARRTGKRIDAMDAAAVAQLQRVAARQLRVADRGTRPCRQCEQAHRHPDPRGSALVAAPMGIRCRGACIAATGLCRRAGAYPRTARAAHSAGAARRRAHRRVGCGECTPARPCVSRCTDRIGQPPQAAGHAGTHACGCDHRAGVLRRRPFQGTEQPARPPGRRRSPAPDRAGAAVMHACGRLARALRRRRIRLPAARHRCSTGHGSRRTHARRGGIDVGADPGWPAGRQGLGQCRCRQPHLALAGRPPTPAARCRHRAVPGEERPGAIVCGLLLAEREGMRFSPAQHRHKLPWRAHHRRAGIPAPPRKERSTP